jgi:2-polyprenyl-3-methyl-5-hydroxy-6-metoxy-1,4-benzoquinol methylase
MQSANAEGAEAPPSLVWEEVPCPLCWARSEELFLSVPGSTPEEVYRLVRCGACGLGYLNPRPDAASIARFYPEEYEPYRPRRTSTPGRWQRWQHRLQRLVLSTYFGYPPPPRRRDRLVAALAAPWLAPGHASHRSIPWSGAGRLLDVGCGCGLFAHRMRQQGWDVVGLDFSEHAARTARETYGIPVHIGSLPHPAIGPESFDAINMGAVLEHIHHPHSVIESAVQALRPGGILAVSVPNFASWSIRTFGSASYLLDLPRHLLHFTPTTLRGLLNTHGLEVSELRLVGRVGWMRRTIKGSRAAERAGVLRRLLGRLATLRPVLGALTRWTVWTRQADQLLAIARKPKRAVRLGG